MHRFKGIWKLAVGLIVTVLVSANGWSDTSTITRLLLNVKIETSTEKKRQAQQDLAGVWVNIEGQYKPVLNFSAEGSVYYLTRIGTYEISTAYAPLTSHELDETLTHLLAEPDNSASHPDNPELAQAISAGLRVRAKNLQRIAAQASARDEQKLSKVHIDMTFPRTMNYGERKNGLNFFYTSSRIYVLDGKKVHTYIREEALSADESSRFSKRGFKRQLENAYVSLRQVCYQLLLSDAPVDECRAKRDRAAELGVKLRPEDVHPRDLTLALPNADHMAFFHWLSEVNGQDRFVPRLDYCLDRVSTPQENLDFYVQLANRGFRNTLWMLQFNRNIPLKNAGNWTEEEYQKVRRTPGSVGLGGGLAYVLLQADGLIGFSRGGAKMEFDLRNRWTFGDQTLRLSFNNDAVWFQYEITQNYPGNGKSNLPLADFVGLDLMRGDYQAYGEYRLSPVGHPDQAELLAAVQAQNCTGGSMVPFVASQDPAPAYAAPTYDGPIEGLPSGFPRYWLARSALANGQKVADPKQQAKMDKGVFYHLGSSDRLGNSEGLAGPYDYPENMSWRLEGTKLIWEIAGHSTERYSFLMEPAAGFAADSVGARNKAYRLLISPASDVDLEVAVSHPESETPPKPKLQDVAKTPTTQNDMPADTLPKWEVIGYWDYDAIDGQQLINGLVLHAKSGSLGVFKWRHQLELATHDKLPPRARKLYPVELNRQTKKVCVNAPYPSYPGYIDLPGDAYDGVYAFASCKGGGY